MLLAVDVGNTTTSLGLYEGDVLARRWTVTSAERTPDEVRLLVTGLLAGTVVTGAVIASVVPPASGALRRGLEGIVTGPIVVVGPGTKTGLAINLDNPRDVGADRIANALGAVERHGSPVVTVDFGTATTIDLVDSDGRFAGGAIAPGVRVAVDALVEATSALRRVDIVVPRRVVGRSTVESIQSGLVFGFAGLVDGIVGRVRDEHDLPQGTPVVATGGLAPVIGPLCVEITDIDDELTLRGLRVVYARN